MKTEGYEGWLCYIPVTSPFPGLNTKLHSQTLSIYILPLSAIYMLTHNDNGKSVPVVQHTELPMVYSEV